MRRNKSTLAILASVFCTLTATAYAHEEDKPHSHAPSRIKHVLLISVDGMHQSDIDWFVAQHPQSTLAQLARQGVTYRNAYTPYPADSFPGMVAQVTGGNPKTTGIYYDDAYSRSLLPAGTSQSACAGATPGAEVYYAEVAAKDQNRLDSGQDIPGLYTDFSKIYQLTGRAQDLLDPAKLPVSPKTCKPVYPHQYLKVNTVFEVAHSHGLHTAWSDKHAAYDILNGPSGQGIDDLFAPEINSALTDPTGMASISADWTSDNTSTRIYDAFKVQAVINWIKGHDHAGNGNPGTPAIFGVNFQSVSTGQKLNISNYFAGADNRGQIVAGGLGGYQADGVTPGPVLASALQYVNDEMQEMVSQLDNTNTAVILSAKHGQSPQKREDLTLINDGAMLDALNCAWEKNSASCTDPTKPHLVAHAIDDDGILLWLTDRSAAATAFARNFLLGYSGSGVGSDAAGNATSKPFTQAGAATIYAGEAAADFIGVPPSDDRVPDVIGVAQHGVVYSGSKLSKIAEHGGDADADRHVPILVWGAGITPRTVDDQVATTQIAPTILKLLGLEPGALQAVQVEHTKVLPGLH